VKGTPRQRAAIFPPWSKAGRNGCPRCGDPVEYAVLDVDTTGTGQRVAIERRVNNRGEVAVRAIGDQLHGYRITQFAPVRPGFVPVMLHDAVCPEAPKPEQRPLFDTQEGTTP
jgi:hypothetical protein